MHQHGMAIAISVQTNLANRIGCFNLSILVQVLCYKSANEFVIKILGSAYFCNVIAKGLDTQTKGKRHKHVSSFHGQKLVSHEDRTLSICLEYFESAT